MKLIEDLGTRPRKGGGTRRWGLYECPVCYRHFECLAQSVKSGNTTKCTHCTDNSAIRAAREFIKKAKAIHGDLYEYTTIAYTNNRTKIEMGCRVHGIFAQTPDEHLRGHGCPHCAKERSNIAMRMSEKNNRPTMLYYIYFPEVNLWKVGCTVNSMEERFSREKLQYTTLQTKEYTSGNEAYRVEKFILDATKGFQYKGTILLKGGNSELRTQPIDNFNDLIKQAEDSL